MKRRTLMRPPHISSEDINTDDNKTPKKTGVQAKKGKQVEEKSRRCRILIKVFQVLFLIVIVPPLLNYASLQKEIKELKPTPGELYDVGWGQKMFKMCQGKGPPTVIFDAPGGQTSDVWALIWPNVAKNARVCVYDRAGLGFSERPLINVTDQDGKDSKNNYRNRWQPFTVERMADDLNHLLTVSSQEPQPFIFVGAELGALVAQFYSQMFENQILGMVLINPLSDDLFEQDSGAWNQYWYGQMVPMFQSLQLGAALGLTRLALLLGFLHQPLFDSELPEDVKYRQKHLLCHPKHLSSVVDEHHFINESFSQLRTVRMIKKLPGNISVTIISGNYYDGQMPSYLNKAWAKSEQILLTKHYPNSKHIVINSADRHMLYNNPSSVTEPINRIVRQWKSKIKVNKKS
ncbi:uncharacterized protein LOC132543120 [Ylistrum balloti]|uniref:uncharacterized protein LOC132543120 n=1 Tax=Ylistrum balloti TaxID=509963 RepID=UPI00290580C4|nr:uncharacterized protein LOC132543120 [Ylistrum balloti]